MLLDPALGWFLVLSFAWLFLPAAWQKARDLPVFAAVLEAYRLLPRGLVPMVAPVVPFAEAALAIGLVLPASRQPSAVALCVVLLTYASAIGINLARGRTDLDCGCTGPLERRPVAAWMVYRNVCLAALALLLTLRWDARDVTALDVFAVTAALTTMIFLWLALDRLLGQVAPRGALLKASR